MAERVTERVYRVRDRISNLYVIDGERVALVDTGSKAAKSRIPRALREVGREVADIGLVLLTHHHLDHVGTAGAWQRLSNAEVAIHPGDAPVLEGKERRRVRGITLRAKTFLFLGAPLMKLYRVPPVPPDRLLGSEPVEAFGLRFETLPAAGHTRGSCAFHLPSEGVLFTGDAALTKAGAMRAPVIAEDREAAMASYRALRRHTAPIVCPGHGDPLRRST